MSNPTYAKARDIPRPVFFYGLNFLDYFKKNIIGSVVYLLLDDNEKLRVLIDPISMPSTKHKNTKYKTAIKLRIGGWWKSSQVFGDKNKLWSIADDWDWSFRLIDRFGNSLFINDIKATLKLINQCDSIFDAISRDHNQSHYDRVRNSMSNLTVIENLETQLSKRTFELEKAQKALNQSQKECSELKKKNCYCKDEDLAKSNEELERRVADLEVQLLIQKQKEVDNIEQAVNAFRATLDKKSIQLKDAWIKYKAKEEELSEAKIKLDAVTEFIEKGKKTKLKTTILEILQ